MNWRIVLSITSPILVGAALSYCARWHHARDLGSLLAAIFYCSIAALNVLILLSD